MERAKIGLLLACCGSVACNESSTGRPPTGLEGLALTSVVPGVVVPDTTFVIEGRSFLDEPYATSWLEVEGLANDRYIELEIPAKFLDYDHLEAVADLAVLGDLPVVEASLVGTARVGFRYEADGSIHRSETIPLELEFYPQLTPRIDQIATSGLVYANDEVAIQGAGVLFGGSEGRTWADVDGCFAPQDGDGRCVPVDGARVEVTPESLVSRTNGSFVFSPAIAGIEPGRFEGQVQLFNAHADGSVTESAATPVVYDLLPAEIAEVGAGGSLGKYIDVQGAGFVGGDEGLTILRVDGSYQSSGTPQVGDVLGIELVPEFLNGNTVRYVLNEEDAIARALEAFGGIREGAGVFSGTMRPVTIYGDSEVVGSEVPMEFRIEPVRQVVYVQFNQTYVESLRKFGLRAVDQLIRDRIFDVLERDYDTIGVEFRAEVPADYKLYSVVEISGVDPNGLGLLGYDNTHGKDTENLRLFDRIGGVNARVQEDGYPGFGGVFIESLFAFSQHPLSGAPTSVASASFDAIFDPFRPDQGGEAVSATDLAGIDLAGLSDGSRCPAADRGAQIACAIFVLGSVVGSTTSHEVGHSLGMAEPYGASFHNNGDRENRLMDAGGARPFEERAELYGLGPSVFCEGSYDYLRDILPTDDSPSRVQRPACF